MRDVAGVDDLIERLRFRDLEAVVDPREVERCETNFRGEVANLRVRRRVDDLRRLEADREAPRRHDLHRVVVDEQLVAGLEVEIVGWDPVALGVVQLIVDGDALLSLHRRDPPQHDAVVRAFAMRPLEARLRRVEDACLLGARRSAATFRARARARCANECGEQKSA
jgi:hypothetical protein